MSKLEELIAKLCPDGIEFKTLGDIAADIYRGSGITRDQVTATGTPCVRYGEIYTTYGLWFDNCASHTDESKIPSKKFFEHGDILFAITGESVEDIAKSCAYVGNEKCLAGGDIVVLKHNQNPKYLAYALSTSDAQKQKSKGKVKSKVVHSSVPAIREIVIPLPPLSIQNEIVRILDSFDERTHELIMELTAELTARQKQYEYYRDLLFTFDGISEQLGDNSRIELQLNDVIQSLKTGLNPRRNFCLNTDDADNYYVTVRELSGKTVQMTEKTDRVNDKALELINNRSNLEVNDVLFSGTGTVGRTALVQEAPTNWNIKEGVYVIKPDTSKIIPMYLMLYLESNVARESYKSKIVGSPVISLPMHDLRKLTIPVPTLSEQASIVAILDRFDALCNDITSDLSAEIEARKKQYEYYRDKLLTFKEKETA